VTRPKAPSEGDSTGRGSARILGAVAGQGCSALGAAWPHHAPSSLAGDLDAGTLLGDPQGSGVLAKTALRAQPFQ